MTRLGAIELADGIGGRRRDWRACRFASIDLETTGLDPTRDSIVSFGVVPVEAGRVRLDRSLYRVVHPGVPMPPEVVVVHGIRPVDLEDAPPLAALVDELRDAMRGSVPVAWTAWVEAGFLAARLGGRARAWERRIVDVRRLAAHLDRLDGNVPSPARGERLADTAARFGVPPDREHHALWDAFVTAELFVVCAARLEAHGLATLRALRRVGCAPRFRDRLR